MFDRNQGEYGITQSVNSIVRKLTPSRSVAVCKKNDDFAILIAGPSFIQNVGVLLKSEKCSVQYVSKQEAIHQQFAVTFSTRVSVSRYLSPSQKTKPRTNEGRSLSCEKKVDKTSEFVTATVPQNSFTTISTQKPKIMAFDESRKISKLLDVIRKHLMEHVSLKLEQK